MQFRPCIDIHNGRVKQIVGNTLRDEGEEAAENFVSDRTGADFARFYQKKGLTGGHVILLNREGSEAFEKTKEQALSALRAYPGGLQLGGGVTAKNAAAYLEAGASHVIVTSYVFHNGRIDEGRLGCLVREVGKNRLVLDLSCKKQEDGYYIVTDRWQKATKVRLTEKVLEELSSDCDEFLIHAVDVEGKAEGIEKELVALLGSWNKTVMTYAGGVHSFEDLADLKELGRNQIHVTIGSALDLFGGSMKFDEVLEYLKR